MTQPFSMASKVPGIHIFSLGARAEPSLAICTVMAMAAMLVPFHMLLRMCEHTCNIFPNKNQIRNWPV